MFDVGRLCLKMAGRDAGQKCVIVEKLEGKYVVIDGMTRRRKCNTLHLEPLEQMLDIGTGTHEHVVKAFKELGFDISTKKSKDKTHKPKAVRRVKPVVEKKSKKEKKKPSEKKKPEAKPEKKESKKEEEK